MTCPRITVVTPSYNQGRFLEATLRSVLDQRYPNLEYMVLDGGSEDGSREIIASHADRLAFWSSGRDGGAYAAVNDGFRRATGEIFAWLNSDDLYLPWTLATVGRIFADCPEVDWISSRIMTHIDADGRALPADVVPGFSRDAFLDGKFLIQADQEMRAQSKAPKIDAGRRAIQQEATFWRRGLWERAGGLDLKYDLAGDFELWSRFWDHAVLHAVPTPLASFRCHAGQRSGAAAAYYHQSVEALLEMRERGGWKPDWLQKWRGNRPGKYCGNVLEKPFGGEGAVWRSVPRRYVW